MQISWGHGDTWGQHSGEHQNPYGLFIHVKQIMTQEPMNGLIPVPEEIASIKSRAVEIAMLAGNYHGAISSVRQAFVDAKEASEYHITLGSYAAEILSVRISNALNDEGIRKISELIRKTPAELEKIPNFSWRTVEKIQKALIEHGFRLGSD